MFKQVLLVSNAILLLLICIISAFYANYIVLVLGILGVGIQITYLILHSKKEAFLNRIIAVTNNAREGDFESRIIHLKGDANLVLYPPTV